MDQKISTNSLALFDFDGTLTTKDSFIEFIKFYHGKAKFFTGIALNIPVLVLFKLGVLPNWKAKEQLMKHFFNEVKISEFNAKASEFSVHQIPKWLKPEMLEILEAHKQMKNDIFLVSASFENWLKAWTDSHGIMLIGSRLIEKNVELTGEISGKNCYGPEKVARIQQLIDLNKYNKIYAYGDSRGDREMLELADFKYFKGVPM